MEQLGVEGDILATMRVRNSVSLACLSPDNNDNIKCVPLELYEKSKLWGRIHETWTGVNEKQANYPGYII